MKKKTRPKAASVPMPEIRQFRLGKLRADPDNPRTVTDQALAGLAASLRQFGYVEPIIVNTYRNENIIIGGHQRLKVLKEQYGSDALCPCLAVKLTPARRRLLNLTLNNPRAQGEFISALSSHIDELRAQADNQQDFLSLQIDALQREVQSRAAITTYKQELLTKPAKRLHILLSLSPALLPKIYEPLQAIIETAGVEYDQASN